jgi:hypothetical protein
MNGRLHSTDHSLDRRTPLPSGTRIELERGVARDFSISTAFKTWDSWRFARRGFAEMLLTRLRSGRFLSPKH